MAEEANEFPICVVDAFADKPFSGNPAAVCLIGHQELDVSVYQRIAAEMNLSETAFIRKKGENEDYKKDNCFNLRWFTPKCEVALCGHATLASAAVLFLVIGNARDSITFETQSGPLNVKRDGNLFCLDMPLNKPLPVEKEFCCIRSYDVELTTKLVDKRETNFSKFKKEKAVEGLQSLIAATIGQLKVNNILYSKTTKKLLVRLDDSTPRSKLEEFVPDVQKMLENDERQLEVRGVIVTVKGSREFGYCNNEGVPFDFVSRYFGPWVGINEDPVTGSAHTVLASYWSAVLEKNDMLARQCSSRGGDLRISLLEGNRVEVAGPATVVLRGVLRHS